MLQFERAEQRRESVPFYIVRDVVVGAWMGLCALLLWPVTLLGLCFWAVGQMATPRSPRTR